MEVPPVHRTRRERVGGCGRTSRVPSASGNISRWRAARAHSVPGGRAPHGWRRAIGIARPSSHHAACTAPQCSKCVAASSSKCETCTSGYAPSAQGVCQKGELLDLGACGTGTVAAPPLLPRCMSEVGGVPRLAANFSTNMPLPSPRRPPRPQKPALLPSAKRARARWSRFARCATRATQVFCRQVCR